MRHECLTKLLLKMTVPRAPSVLRYFDMTFVQAFLSFGLSLT